MKPDPKYRWRYIIKCFSDSRTHKAIQRFRSITRCGVPQSDWVSGMTWGTPVVALAPPVGGLNE